MESTSSRIAVFGKVLRIIYIGVLLLHLLLWAMDVKGRPLGNTAFEGDKEQGINLPAGKAGNKEQRLFPEPGIKNQESRLGGGKPGVSARNPIDRNPTSVRSACPPLAGVGGGQTSSHSVTKRNLVREIYTSQIGVREKQPNSGPEVEKYLRYVNLPKGNPWCAAFVCWTLGKAGVDNPRSGWSPDLFAVKRVIWPSSALPVSRIKYQPACRLGRESRLGGGKLDGFSLNAVVGNKAASRCACPPPAGVGGGFCPHNPQTPGAGDVFGLYFPEKGRIAHVGFVDEWKDGWVITVEGNTNVLGSRDGDGVYRKRRLVRSIYKVARYVE
ncbi:CHAP domain-containing protein [Daejeonella lutea]|uniref:CHAP domain-containing protein n=1 Tax=Daejeonella lutea TaxID=572036 RepID=A0A1T5CXY8_9SPHI|nr:CHAP domain-containing protein [Daejeonella lutea]SKB64206.1 hypothetical protein SAMN05661099_2002 [Daejeonella lutea]